MHADELGHYLEKKGLLHDCLLSWRDLGEGRLSVEVSDVNAATHGLPEYPGASRLILELEGVCVKEMVAPADELRVFEASARLSGEAASLGEFRVTFWPAGHMTLSFAAARVTERPVRELSPR